MFTIIGGDGKEYGPVTADQIRGWVAEGRANLDTKAKAVGSEEWRRVGDYAEFSTPEGAPPVVASTLSTTASVAPANLADRGTRLGARFIDWVVAFLGVLPGGIILGGEFINLVIMASQGRQPDFEELNVQRLGVGGVVFGIGWLIVLVAQVILLSTRGQSIGKIITKLRVVRAVDGAQAGFVHAWLLREAVITVIGVVLGVLPFLGLALRPGFHLTDWCMIFRDDRRCLHDLIAGTQVVKV